MPGSNEYSMAPEFRSGASEVTSIKPALVSKPVQQTKPTIEQQIAGAKSFNEAFRLARKAGLKQFDWKGKPIAVKLKTEEKTVETQPKDSEQINKDVVNTDWKGIPYQTSEGESAWKPFPLLEITPADNTKVSAQPVQPTKPKLAAKPEKKNNWFTNAILGAAMAENPAVMTASGWRQNEAGDFVQDKVDDPGVVALRNNLATLGGTVLAGTAAAALAPAAASGAATTLPAIKASGSTAVQTVRTAAPMMETKALPIAQNILRDAAGNIIKMWKNGGQVRTHYFQQGGAVSQQQDMQQQIKALVLAAMQGDQKATQTVNQIMEAAKAGDQQALQIAQMIQQVVQQMLGQVTTAKWGAKLGYIRSLKFANGGKACPACQAGAPIKPIKKVEEKACGGKAKKAKKRYFGGWL